MISTVSNVVHLLLIVLSLPSALHFAGMHTIIIGRILDSITLAAVGLIVPFRPYIPTLPFKVGDTIKTGDLFGKVEATAFLNTRLKTFEGMTVFVPNSKILNDYVTNYHFTPTRRVKIDVGIGYDQDILKAEQVLESIMIEDPRVGQTQARCICIESGRQLCGAGGAMLGGQSEILGYKMRSGREGKVPVRPGGHHRSLSPEGRASLP